jgi:hypothetical protein
MAGLEEEGGAPATPAVSADAVPTVPRGRRKKAQARMSAADDHTLPGGGERGGGEPYPLL